MSRQGHTFYEVFDPRHGRALYRTRYALIAWAYCRCSWRYLDYAPAGEGWITGGRTR